MCGRYSSASIPSGPRVFLRVNVSITAFISCVVVFVISSDCIVSLSNVKGLKVVITCDVFALNRCSVCCSKYCVIVSVCLSTPVSVCKCESVE